MAEEQLELSEKYKKGFNDAYRLSETMPQLFSGMGLPKGDASDYTKGFDDGRKEYEREHMKDKLREFYKGKGKNQDHGRQK